MEMDIDAEWQNELGAILNYIFSSFTCIVSEGGGLCIDVPSGEILITFPLLLH